MENIDKIHNGINKAHKNALVVDYETDSSKFIIFSDHHRGKGDGADDFKVCEPVYKNALGHYLQDDFNLVLLGDIEEFWENTTLSVLKKYKEVGQLEKQFHVKQKLYKIWGNHDDNWRFNDFVNRHLALLFPQLKCHEAIELKINSEGETLGYLLLVHGHQGALASDRWAWVSKIFVRYIWRNFQRIFKVNINTPRKDKGLKSTHDQAFYQWASNKKKQAVVCGHTHQPVFISNTHIDHLHHQKDLAASIEEKMILEEKIQAISDIGSRIECEHDKKPCYFNTGCCSFSDGDITGIEVENENIRLIKWSQKGREILGEVGLKNIF